MKRDATIADGRQVSSVTVGKADAGRRLDVFLTEALDGHSRNRVKALIKSGAVTSGEEDRLATDPAARISAGDSFTVSIPSAAPAAPAGQAIPLDVVYEDEHLIVIDKPAGLVVHPAPGNPDRTLVNALISHCAGSLSGIGGVARPGIVHRLDKDTSGVMVAAKTDVAHAGLAKQFAQHSLTRAYKAVVWGVPRPLVGQVKGRIGRHPSNRKKMAVVADGGREALTYYRVEERYREIASLLKCRLATGRTHQIRVHMAQAGHPVIGDRIYGRPRRTPGVTNEGASSDVAANLRRQALHACAIGFDHPVTLERLEFSSELPNDLRNLISFLEKI